MCLGDHMAPLARDIEQIRFDHIEVGKDDIEGGHKHRSRWLRLEAGRNSVVRQNVTRWSASTLPRRRLAPNTASSMTAHLSRRSGASGESSPPARRLKPADASWRKSSR